MKKITVIFSLLIFIGCNNNSKPQESTTQEKTNSDQNELINDKNKVTSTTKDGLNKFRTGKDDSNKNQKAGTQPHQGGQEPSKASSNNTAGPSDNHSSQGTSAGNSGSDGTKKKTQDEKTGDIPTTASGLNTGTKSGGLTDDNGGKPIVFIGVFAQWKDESGAQYDGSYDTTHNLFVFCSNHQCRKIPEDQILFRQFGSCDLALNERIQVFQMKKDGSINPYGNKLKIVGNKGIIGVGAASRFVELDQPTLYRINNAKFYNNPGTYKEPLLKPQQEFKVNKPGYLKVDTKIETDKTNFVQPNILPMKEKIMVQPSESKIPVEIKTITTTTTTTQQINNKLPAAANKNSEPVKSFYKTRQLQETKVSQKVILKSIQQDH